MRAAPWRQGKKMWMSWDRDCENWSKKLNKRYVHSTQPHWKWFRNFFFFAICLSRASCASEVPSNRFKRPGLLREMSVNEISGFGGRFVWWIATNKKRICHNNKSLSEYTWIRICLYVDKGKLIAAWVCVCEYAFLINEIRKYILRLFANGLDTLEPVNIPPRLRLCLTGIFFVGFLLHRVYLLILFILSNTSKCRINNLRL